MIRFNGHQLDSQENNGSQSNKKIINKGNQPSKNNNNDYSSSNGVKTHRLTMVCSSLDSLPGSQNEGGYEYKGAHLRSTHPESLTWNILPKWTLVFSSLPFGVHNRTDWMVGSPCDCSVLGGSLTL